MKFSVFMAVFALLIVFPITAKAMDENKMAMTDAPIEKVTPAIKAVIFYSETCGSCKILEPRMMKAMDIINKDKLDVVKFDFSNKASIEATKALAKEKGVNDILQENGARTGWVALVDQSGKVVDKLKVDDDVASIASKIVTAVANAS